MVFMQSLCSVSFLPQPGQQSCMRPMPLSSPWQARQYGDAFTESGRIALLWPLPCYGTNGSQQISLSEAGAQKCPSWVPESCVSSLLPAQLSALLSLTHRQSTQRSTAALFIETEIHQSSGSAVMRGDDYKQNKCGGWYPVLLRP